MRWKELFGGILKHEIVTYDADGHASSVETVITELSWGTIILRLYLLLMIFISLLSLYSTWRVLSLPRLGPYPYYGYGPEDLLINMMFLMFFVWSYKALGKRE